MAINDKTWSRVSVIGLGAMGSTIARLLLGAGYGVTVWNRTAAKADVLAREGAAVASDVAAAVGASPLVVICVHDYAATNEILGAEGVTQALNGKLLIQLTTGGPQEARDAEAWAHQRGAHYLDGAIQVAPDQMARPDTTLLVSGAEAAFRQGEPLLRVLGGNVKYLGEKVGAASAMDTATLSYVYGSALGFFQGALFCEAEGFGTDEYGAIVAEIAPGFGEFLKHEGEVIQSGDFRVSQSPLSISVVATERIAQAARDAGIDADFPEFVARVLRRTEAAGYGGEEAAAIIKVLRREGAR